MIMGGVEVALVFALKVSLFPIPILHSKNCLMSTNRVSIYHRSLTYALVYRTQKPKKESGHSSSWASSPPSSSALAFFVITGIYISTVLCEGSRLFLSPLMPRGMFFLLFLFVSFGFPCSLKRSPSYRLAFYFHPLHLRVSAEPPHSKYIKLTN